MKLSLAVAAAAMTMLTALPFAASAHHKPTHSGGPPPWAGTPGSPHGAGQATPPTAGSETPPTEAGAPPSAETAPPPARCKKPQRVGFTVAGTFASYAAPQLAVDVTAANRHARSYLADAEPSFDVSGAEATFTGIDDADLSGAVGFEDALAADTVELGGKLIRPKRGCEAEISVRIDHAAVSRPLLGQ